MSKHSIYIIDLLSGFHYYRHLSTGSREFGDNNENSDWDYVVQLSEKLINLNISQYLQNEGFEVCGENAYSLEEGYLIVRKILDNGDNLNLIIVDDSMIYEGWRSCTFLSKSLKLNKSQRQTLFQEIIDGLLGL